MYVIIIIIINIYIYYDTAQPALQVVNDVYIPGYVGQSMTSARSTPRKSSSFNMDEQLNWVTGYYDTAQPALQVVNDA